MIFKTFVVVIFEKDPIKSCVLCKFSLTPACLHFPNLLLSKVVNINGLRYLKEGNLQCKNVTSLNLYNVA